MYNFMYKKFFFRRLNIAYIWDHLDGALSIIKIAIKIN